MESGTSGAGGVLTTGADLAALYYDRWQAETGIGEITTEQRGSSKVVLRPKIPDMVAQGFWALLCVYQSRPPPDRPARATGLRPASPTRSSQLVADGCVEVGVMRLVAGVVG